MTDKEKKKRLIVDLLIVVAGVFLYGYIVKGTYVFLEPKSIIATSFIPLLPLLIIYYRHLSERRRINFSRGSRIANYIFITLLVIGCALVLYGSYYESTIFKTLHSIGEAGRYEVALERIGNDTFFLWPGMVLAV